MTSAWVPSPATNSLKLNPTHARNQNGAPSASFNFDAVLTGTPNKPIYTTVARSHVHAAMEGYNAVIFAYGQTASGKTFTLTGSDDEPGIIPRAMRDVFAFIRRTPSREYLLRCSYLEIYNESIHDLLAPPSMAAANPVQIQGGAGSDILLTPLREEVVISLKGVKEVLKRGEGNRRTACTDWNDRSSRSHSVFRLVVESRERGSGTMDDDDDEGSAPAMNERHTPVPNGRHTPGLGGRQTPGLGGARLQARRGKSVQTSVLVRIFAILFSPRFLIVFSEFDRFGRIGKSYIRQRENERGKIYQHKVFLQQTKYNIHADGTNPSLLTLGTVIGTLADNAAKNKA